MYRYMFSIKLKYIMIYRYFLMYRCGPATMLFQCIDIILHIDIKSVSIFFKVSILTLHRFCPNISIYTRAKRLFLGLGSQSKACQKKRPNSQPSLGRFQLLQGDTAPTSLYWVPLFDYLLEKNEIRRTQG